MSGDPELSKLSASDLNNSENNKNDENFNDATIRAQQHKRTGSSPSISTTTGQSVYTSAQSNASNATVTRSETDNQSFQSAQPRQSMASERSDQVDSEKSAPKPHADDAASAPAVQPAQFVGAAGGVPVAAPAPSSTTGATKSETSSQTKGVNNAASRSETSSQTKGAGGGDPEKHGKGGDSSSGEGESIDMDDPELAKLNEQQREVVLAQIFTPKRKPVGFLDLWRYATKLEIAFNVIGIITSVVAGALQPAMTIFFGSLTNALVNYQTVKQTTTDPAIIAQARDIVIHQVNKNVLNLVYVAIGVFFATWIYMASFVYSGEQITRRIRENYLRSVLRQNVAYFDKMGAGEVTTRIQSDMHLIQEGISDKVPMTTMFLGTFFAGFIIAIVRNWRLALVVSTIIPVIAMAGGTLNKFVSGYRAKMLEKTSAAGTLAEEVISSIRNAHAFSTQQKLAKLYDGPNSEAQRIGGKSALAGAGGLGVMFFVIYAAYALAFYYGTTLILQGRANAGQVINVFFSIMIGAFSLAMMAPNLQAFAFARGAANEIYRTIERVPIIDSASPEGQKPEHIDGVLSFHNVDFIYPARPSVQVLFDFNATFPRGKTTALVGASGSGKSTCIGLIERFYDPVGGKVMLDGIELKDLNLKWLRSHIGLVSQEPTLFATTVAGNIEHGLIGTKFENETAEQKRERVINAAKMANADGFITALPEGYDTMIGERGMLLSGGQRQRISIARAIVSDPQILLLDEATSALDTTSEAIVQDALDRAAEGRTTVTIAHRLSTIKNAHQIIVMSEGRQLESAMSEGDQRAHDILLSNPNGAYTRLVSAQKLREQQESDAAGTEDSSDAGEDDGPQTLTREQAEKMAQEEKPMFENLKRTGTGRSAASEALSAKYKADVEAGRVNPKEHSFPYLFWRIISLNKDQKWLYLIGFAASVGTGCVYPVKVAKNEKSFARTDIRLQVYGGVIGAFSETGQALRDGGDRYALYSFIIAIVATIFIVLQQWTLGTSVERLSRKLRYGIFRAILRQDIAYFDKEENSTGHLTSSVAEWAQKVNGLFGVTMGTIIQSTFTLISGVIIGIIYAWRIGLVGMACIPLTMAAGLVRLRVVVLKDKKNKKAHEQSAQMACEAAAAIRTVASLTREDDCCNIYSRALDAPARESNRTALIANTYYSLSQSLTFLVIGLIFWYGAHQLVSGTVTSSTFFVAMIAVIFGSIQAGNVFNYVPDMSSARGAAAEIVKLFDARPDIDAEEPIGDIVPEAAVQGWIKFSNVHFRYPSRPHVRVLRGLNLEVKPGQFAAIVGPSGCGKSTLIQLVERFYDPLSGQVLIDGHNVSDLNVNEYRKHIALVSQEPTLYAGTVKFNITLGATKPESEISQAEIEQACRDANIHDFIMTLPDAYETEVGGKGTQLSGGQRQRIAIARALIRKPKVLLLDEATSALDSESEKVVQKALDQAAKGRTTIAVAHRLSTIQNADVIYVLKDGKVFEQGTHWELLHKKGAYFELVAQQSLQKH